MTENEIEKYVVLYELDSTIDKLKKAIVHLKEFESASKLRDIERRLFESKEYNDFVAKYNGFVIIDKLEAIYKDLLKEQRWEEAVHVRTCIRKIEMIQRLKQTNHPSV